MGRTPGRVDRTSRGGAEQTSSPWAAHGPAALLGAGGFGLRHLLWISLLLVPADALAALLGGGASLLFLLSVVALVPLAYVIGEATEQAGEHTGSVIAGLLNASFGNAPELIIALFAVDRGLPDVVFGSLTGSVVSNLLLVLGVSTLAAHRGVVNRRSSGVSLVMTTLAVVLFSLTTTLHLTGAVSGTRLPVAVPVCAALLAAYVLVTAVSVVRARRQHADRRIELAPPAAEENEQGDGGWSLATALTVLALATAATALVSEILTGSIEQFAHSAGLPDFFVAAVIVAIVGNAAEHGGAVVIARGGNLGLAAEIAFSSSAQVATLVLPLVVLLSVAIAPLSVVFRPVELVTIGVAVLVPALLISARVMTRLSGVVLCLTYGGVAAAFYFFA